MKIDRFGLRFDEGENESQKRIETRFFSPEADGVASVSWQCSVEIGGRCSIESAWKEGTTPSLSFTAEARSVETPSR